MSGLLDHIAGKKRFRVRRTRFGNYEIINTSQPGLVQCWGLMKDALSAARAAKRFEDGRSNT